MSQVQTGARPSMKIEARFDQDAFFADLRAVLAERGITEADANFSAAVNSLPIGKYIRCSVPLSNGGGTMNVRPRTEWQR